MIPGPTARPGARARSDVKARAPGRALRAEQTTEADLIEAHGMTLREFDARWRDATGRRPADDGGEA